MQTKKRRGITRSIRAATGCVRGAIVAVALLSSGGGVASADSCPNAAFRTGPSAALPDCRAYELVSPPFKFGQIPFTEVLRAFDETHLILDSLGAFNEPGDNATASGANYLVTREAQGWSSGPIDPPAALFQNGGVLNARLVDVSSDFHKEVFLETPATSRPVDQRLYIRNRDGSLPEVGPAVPPGAVAEWTPQPGDEPSVSYAGASSDLSHILFTIEANQTPTRYLWPGDTTLQIGSGRKSLYEYVGTGHTGLGTSVPRLIGVDSEGHLISQCGTDLGSLNSEDAYNAISTSGETIFFTPQLGGCTQEGITGAGPAVAELYARVAGETVAISEPSKKDCSACNTVLAERRDGTFQGAARGGSRVFFLSEQSLLPGAAGLSLYEYNFAAENEGKGPGKRVTLIAPNVLGVARVSQEGTRVYFVAAGNILERYDTVTGLTATIATLSSEDGEDWSASDSRPVEATPDGRYLLFQSANDLTSDSEGTGHHLYRYDAQTGAIVRISIGENGFNHNGNTNDAPAFPNIGYGIPVFASVQRVSISADGAYVFFQSAGGLTPQAANDVPLPEKGFAQNVYEYHERHVHLISDGQDFHEAFGGGSVVGLVGATPSGSDVFFETVDSLVSQDKDTQRDVYDARINGGFAPLAQPVPCQPEACQGAVAPIPGAPVPGSSTFVGPGNVEASAPTPPSTKLVGSSRALARALAACRGRPRAARAACVRHARRRYASRTSRRRTGKAGR